MSLIVRVFRWENKTGAEMSGVELLGRYFSLLDEDEILELYKENYFIIDLDIYSDEGP